jgi:hypothetical protein
VKLVVDAKKGIVEATVPVGTCLDRDRETGFLYLPNAFTSRSVSVIRDDR